jgi:hypothetical protein
MKIPMRELLSFMTIGYGATSKLIVPLCHQGQEESHHLTVVY